MNEERLHKFLARAGLASRRKAEEMIRDGRVFVNGEQVTTMGTKITDSDRVEVDGQCVQSESLEYLLMYKPKGYVTTLSDPQRRPTVARLIPDIGAHVKPVGRLDMDSEGLLLLTNDGPLAARLIHPRYGVEKEYEVIVLGEFSEKSAKRLEKGVTIDDRKTAPCTVEIIRASKQDSVLRFILHEGRNRQIRRMCETVGHPVRHLKRVRIGPLKLQKLSAGQVRLLTVPEVRTLYRLTKLSEIETNGRDDR